jgi:glycosyltransferase involved in cell wall biosynthesis
MSVKKRILFSPSHFVFSDSLGSELNESYLLIKHVSLSNRYDLTTICGSTHLQNDVNNYTMIEIWKDYSNHNTNNFTLKDSLIFNIKYTNETIKQLYFTKTKYSIFHHIRPFALFSTFNFSIIFNFKRIPVVVGPFCAPYQSKRNGVIKNILKYLNYLTLRAASVILVNDSETKTQIEDFIGKKTVQIFPVGKNISESNYKEKNYDKDEYHFLASGQLIERKNVQFMIEGFAAALKKSTKKLILHIIGDGDQKEDLMRLSKQLGIDKSIIFHGKIPFSEIENWYREADFFLHTAKEEAFGHVLIEALIYGLPVVTSTTVGSRAVVGLDCGFISEQEDINTFSQNILTLVNDPLLSKSVSKNARNHAEEHFDWDNILLPKLEQIYDSISNN